MDVLVGVDLGTKCGIAWTLVDAGGHYDQTQVSVVSYNYTKVKQQGAGMRPLMFRRDLIKLFGIIKPNEVVFENVQRHTATYAAQIFGELRGVLMSVCEELSIPYRGIGVTTVKKHITGKGNASKDRVRYDLKMVWSFIDRQNEDEVDALSILKTAIDGVI